MIICFFLITKQHILCGLCKEKLQTDKLAGLKGLNRFSLGIKCKAGIGW